MRNCLFLFCLLAYLPLKATFLEEIAIETGAGYRWDHLNWNIGAPSGSPDVLSELVWEDLGIWQINAQARMFFCQNVYVRLQADYGWIVNGVNHDFDFLGDHRTQLFSHSISQSNQGGVYDLSGGIGYPLEWNCQRFQLIPLIGYSEHAQHLTMKKGELVFNFFAPHEVGSIHNLHSTYRTRWYGPWLGVDAIFHPTCYLSLFATYEYHWVYYRAKADWNLRLDMPDGFCHEANGHGQVIRLGAQYEINEQWFASFFAHYQIWRTRLGADVTDLVDEAGHSFEFYQPLNRVNWRSLALIISIGYQL